MDINGTNPALASLFMIAMLSWLLPLSINVASRGITVKTKTSSGAVKEIQLYSGYRSLFIADSLKACPDAV